MKTPISPTKPGKWASSSKNVAISTLWLVKTRKHSAQEINRETALHTSQKKDKNLRIPFTLTYYPYNLTNKTSCFETKRPWDYAAKIFSLPPLFFQNRQQPTQLSSQKLTKIQQPIRTLQNAHAHDVSPKTLKGFRYVKGPSTSMIDLHASPAMQSTE